MMLELTHREAVDLQEALAAWLRDFRDEVIHTDDRDVRADLKQTYERLESLRQKIAQAAQQSESQVYG